MGTSKDQLIDEIYYLEDMILDIIYRKPLDKKQQKRLAKITDTRAKWRKEQEEEY